MCLVKKRRNKKGEDMGIRKNGNNEVVLSAGVWKGLLAMVVGLIGLLGTAFGWGIKTGDLSNSVTYIKRDVKDNKAKIDVNAKHISNMDVSLAEIKKDVKYIKEAVNKLADK